MDTPPPCSPPKRLFSLAKWVFHYHQKATSFGEWLQKVVEKWSSSWESEKLLFFCCCQNEYFILRHVFIGFCSFSHQINIIHKLGAWRRKSQNYDELGSPSQTASISLGSVSCIRRRAYFSLSSSIFSCHILTHFKMWTSVLFQSRHLPKSASIYVYSQGWLLYRS